MIEHAIYILSQISPELRTAYIILTLMVVLADIILWFGFNKCVHWTTLLLGIYILFILIVTLMIREPGTGAEYSLTLFWSWIEVFSHNDIALLWQNLLNIILFVPLGILLGIRKTKILKATIAGFLLSASIELTQLLFHLGFFEWDDMFHNTLGCVMGALLGRFLLGLIRWGFRIIRKPKP